MQVLEDEHERAHPGQSLQEAPPGKEGFRAPVVPGAGLAREPDKCAEVPFHPLCFGVVSKGLAHRAPGCIFVSYATPDLLIAEFIVKQLQDKGLLVWFAPQQILPGQDWKAEFSEAVEAASPPDIR